MMAGRPSTFTEELADSICNQIAQGDSLNQISKREGMPDAATVHRWMNKNPDFAANIARAREAQAEFYAESIIEIADELEIDATYKGEDVKLDVSAAAVARNRLRIDARKWHASKLAPKKYGDKLEVDQTTRIADLTTEQIDARIAQLTKQG